MKRSVNTQSQDDYQTGREAHNFVVNINQKLKDLKKFYDTNTDILSTFITINDLEKILKFVINLGTSKTSQIIHSSEHEIFDTKETAAKKTFSIIRYDSQFRLILDKSSTASYKPIQMSYSRGNFKMVIAKLDITDDHVVLIANIRIRYKEPSKENIERSSNDALEEIKLSRKLSHTNLIQYHLSSFKTDIANDYHYALIESYSDFFTCNLRIYLQTIITYSQEEKNAQTPHLIQALRDLFSALTYLHEKGYIHQDVKPENILFSKFSRFVLTDFGLTSFKNDNRLPTTTPSYESPEVYNTHKILYAIDKKNSHYDFFSQFNSIGRVFRGLYKIEEPLKTADYSTDIWAVGIIAHEILTDQIDYSSRKTPVVIEKSPFLKQLLNPDYRQRISAKQAGDLFKESGEEELTKLLSSKNSNKLFCR